MKRKLILIVTVMLAAILAVALLTSCNNSAESLDTFINNNDYLTTNYNKSISIQSLDIDGEVFDLGTPFYITKKIDTSGQEEKTIYSVYSIVTKDCLLSFSSADDGNPKLITVYGIENVFAVTKTSEEEQDVKLLTMYDSFGTIIFNDLKYTNFDINVKSGEYYNVIGKDISYHTYYINYLDENKVDQKKLFTIRKEGSLSIYTTETVFTPSEQGQALENDITTTLTDDGYFKLRYNDKPIYYSEDYYGYKVREYNQNSEALVILYNKEGKEKSRIVIPTEYTYVGVLDQFKFLAYKIIKVVSLQNDYTYTDGGIAYKLEYYTIDILHGKIKSVKLNYTNISAVDNTTKSYDAETNKVKYTGLTNLGLIANKIEDKKVNNETCYLLLRNDGTIKADVTSDLEKKGIYGSVKQIAENKYLVQNTDNSFIANEKLEKITDLNMIVDSVDYKQMFIIGHYFDTTLNKSIYGVVDFDGKILTPFKYTDLVRIIHSDVYPVYYAADYKTGKCYFIDVTQNRIITEFGSYTNDDIDYYTGLITIGGDIIKTRIDLIYTNTLETYQYLDEDEELTTDYYVRCEIFDMYGNSLAVTRFDLGDTRILASPDVSLFAYAYYENNETFYMSIKDLISNDYTYFMAFVTNK